jgi:hypothetical protein
MRLGFRPPGSGHCGVDTSMNSTGFCSVDTLRSSEGSSGNTVMWVSNSNGIEAKQRESFDNGDFFDIKAKQTRSLVRNLFPKQCEHVYIKELKY